MVTNLLLFVVAIAAAFGGLVAWQVAHPPERRLWLYEADDRRDWSDVRGKVQASSAEEVEEILYSRQLKPKPGTIRPVPVWKQSLSVRPSQLRTKVSARQLADMAHAMASYLASDMPIQEAIENYIRQRPNNRCREVLARVQYNLRRGGMTLAEAISAEAAAFGTDVVAMISAGTRADGGLEGAFEQIASMTDKQADLNRQILKALGYPVVVLVVLFAAMTFMVGYILPQFSGIYRSLGSTLPTMTRIVIDFSNLFYRNLWLLVLVVAAVVGGVVWTRRNRQARRQADRLLLKVPVLGGIWQRTSMGRAMAVLSGMVSVGIPTQEAFALAIPAAGNRHIEETLTSVSEMLGTHSLRDAVLSHRDSLPESLVSYVEIGSQAADLDKMLRRYASITERDVDAAIATLSSALQPALIVCLGAVVGFFVVAMYSPMWDMVKLININQ